MSAPRPSEERDADFMARFDAERARILRRRTIIYCAVALSLLAFSLLGTAMSLRSPPSPDYLSAGVWKVELLFDGTLVALYVGALVYVCLVRPDRARLVAAVTILTVLAASAAMVYEPVTDRLDPEVIGKESAAQAWYLGLMTLGAYSVLQWVGLLLIPMPLRESARIAVPCFVVCTLVAVGIIRRPALPVAGTIVLFVPASLPGMLWSAWRFREFDERFRSRELSGQLKEISAELSYARRVHEALFPPPVERGPVRLDYRYEPMREIGGDFLFVHPMLPPPAANEGSLSVVLLDVTGHGVAAALAVNRLHGELLRCFAEFPEARPGRVVCSLNAYARVHLAPQAIFATAICLRLDPGAGSAAWASAGHPTAFLRKADGGTREMGSTAPMLGVLEAEDFDPGERAEPLAQGETVAAFTDGVIEAADARGEQLGVARIRAAIAAAGSRVRDQVAGVASAVERHRHGRVRDDVLIVAAGFAGMRTLASGPESSGQAAG